MNRVTEKKEFNKDVPIPALENKDYILSLTNNARQFKNEFTLIENYEKTNNKFKVEIHKKFTLALACILFTMVGAPLGILVRNGGMTIASGLSIAFFLVYYILLIWGEQLADRNLLNPGLGSCASDLPSSSSISNVQLELSLEPSRLNLFTSLLESSYSFWL